MSKLIISAFSVSIDGFAAGPRQDRDHPLGVRGLEAHDWFFQTEVFKKIQGQAGGSKGIDNDVAAESFKNVGAWIMGRNMFGPVRGPWVPDAATGELWQGWWGPDPPFHTPVFVLTHHARAPLAMQGGSTFHFVTGGSDSALEQAREAADGKDVRVGGGVATIRQFLAANLIDEMHLALAPVLLGEGENLLAGINLPRLGFVPVRTVRGENATHVFLRRNRE